MAWIFPTWICISRILRINELRWQGRGWTNPSESTAKSTVQNENLQQKSVLISAADILSIFLTEWGLIGNVYIVYITACSVVYIEESTE